MPPVRRSPSSFILELRAVYCADADQPTDAGCSGSASRWHATHCPASANRSSGSSVRQRSNTYGHLVWKRHPLGGLIGLGTSPFRMIGLRTAPGSGTGTADRRALV